MAVWLEPDASVQVTETRSPGWWAWVSELSVFWLSTALPPKAVMVSPVVMPALSAGEPLTTPWMVTPLVLEPVDEPLAEP